MDAAQFLFSICAINVAVAAPQLNIPGVRRVSTTRNTVSDSTNQDGPSFSSFPSRFNRNQNVEAEISSLTVENPPPVSSVFRTNSVTRTSGAGNGNDALAVLNNRFSAAPTGSSGSGLLSSIQTTSTAAKSSGRSEDEPVMLMPYSFNYNVADDDYQTYIAREEESDGETVVGSYSYVDPTGALITVNYRAGLMGYTETREKQENFIKIRSNPVQTSKQTVTTTSSSTGSSATGLESKFTSSSSSSGSSSNKFSSGSGSSGGSQQLTTTVTKKKSVDQAALIAQILAVLQPQISSIVDSSINEVEEVTEERTVTVQKIPNTSSTFEFSEQSSTGNSNNFGK
eukprot:TRINITY_DN11511_c0_g1_i2.p1 TRINITY_DN11511_c0_g1~~TRINITY_DN11511_c0_g1_i2.p1  ORF type:complete len:354 (+),score=107.26 TRINITY_DN11511_c0_g1_i2:40-1062(+)